MWGTLYITKIPYYLQNTSIMNQTGKFFNWVVYLQVVHAVRGLTKLI